MEKCFPLLWNLVSLRFQKQFAVLPFHYICGIFNAVVWTINFDRVQCTLYTAVLLLVNNLPQLSSVPAQEESYYLKWKMLTKVVYRHPLLLTNFVSLKQSSIVIVQTWGGNIAGEASNLSGGGNPSKYHLNWATKKLGWEEHLSNREFPANQHSPTILKMKQHSKIWFVFKAFKHIYRRYDSQQDDGNY